MPDFFALRRKATGCRANEQCNQVLYSIVEQYLVPNAAELQPIVQRVRSAFPAVRVAAFPNEQLSVRDEQCEVEGPLALQKVRPAPHAAYRSGDGACPSSVSPPSPWSSHELCLIAGADNAELFAASALYDAGDCSGGSISDHSGRGGGCDVDRRVRLVDYTPKT